MNFKLKLILEYNDSTDVIIQDVAQFTKECSGIEHIGLSIAESKTILSNLQDRLVKQQIDTYLHTVDTCSVCSKP